MLRLVNKESSMSTRRTHESGSTGGGHGAPDPRVTVFIPNPKARLREQVHETMRFFHYSRRTEETYWGWIRRFLMFHRTASQLAPTSQRAGKQWRHPRDMGATEVAAFLS